MYEPRNIPPIPSGRFFLRILSHGLIALALVSVSLVMGITGYMTTGKMSMLDVFLNTSMLLGGMGTGKNRRSECGGKALCRNLCALCRPRLHRRHEHHARSGRPPHHAPPALGIRGRERVRKRMYTTQIEPDKT